MSKFPFTAAVSARGGGNATTESKVSPAIPADWLPDRTVALKE